MSKRSSREWDRFLASLREKLRQQNEKIEAQRQKEEAKRKAGDRRRRHRQRLTTTDRFYLLYEKLMMPEVYLMLHETACQSSLVEQADIYCKHLVRSRFPENSFY